MSVLLVVLALLVSGLVGSLLGAWGAFRFVRMLKPGREGDLLAELAGLRASASLHHAALKSESAMWQAVSQNDASP